MTMKVFAGKNYAVRKILNWYAAKDQYITIDEILPGYILPSTVTLGYSYFIKYLLYYPDHDTRSAFIVVDNDDLLTLLIGKRYEYTLE